MVSVDMLFLLVVSVVVPQLSKLNPYCLIVYFNIFIFVYKPFQSNAPVAH